MGCIDGGTISQTVGGQIGGISIELEQIGVMFPFTHLQTQLPNEFVVKNRIDRKSSFFISQLTLG